MKRAAATVAGVLAVAAALALAGCGRGGAGAAAGHAVDAAADAVHAGIAGAERAGMEPAGADASSPPALGLPALDRVGGIVVGTPFAPDGGDRGWRDEGQVPEADCGHYSGGVLPPGMTMMVVGGRIARFELRDRDPGDGAAGPYGLRPGMSRAEVLARLPDGVETAPHAYGGEDDVYLTWRPAGTGLGLRVEVVDGQADAVFWGRADAVVLIEGCT